MIKKMLWDKNLTIKDSLILLGKYWYLLSFFLLFSNNFTLKQMCHLLVKSEGQWHHQMDEYITQKGNMQNEQSQKNGDWLISSFMETG